VASLAQTASKQRAADAREIVAGAVRVHEGETRYQLVHRQLTDMAVERVLPLMAAAYGRADRIYRGAGATDASDRLAACAYTADVLVELAAEGELDGADTQLAAAALAGACDEPVESTTFDLFLRSVYAATLLELPPLVATEIQLRFLLHFDAVDDVSLWHYNANGTLVCVFALGGEPPGRRVRATAKAALQHRSTRSEVGRSTLRWARVLRFGEPFAVVVARVRPGTEEQSAAYVEECAGALTPVLEREHLLERSASRERALVGAGEKRLMRLGFDLHDGSIQDVLALADETRRLRDEVYPFVDEAHRELAYGRFDDLLARLVELDRQLREIAHSLESKSIVSRPVAETLHREVDAFGDRTGIAARLEIRGDPESLTSAQRIAVFRAIQESLANVREHSGATSVEIRLRARRNSIHVRILDNGQGFEVSRALARAAQRGRLGLVGIGERVRMLGGTFEIDSAPGGPTSLMFTLPRWQPLQDASHEHQP
jgi:signal transduction histidine kinase